MQSGPRPPARGAATTRSSFRRLAAALVAVLWLAAVASPVAANGIGDLYAATRDGVLELHVDSARVVNVVPLVPGPTALAFSADGRALFAAGGLHRVVRIDIETLAVGDPVTLPGIAAALAYPQGIALAIALRDRGTIGVLSGAAGATEVRESGRLPGAPDLLAADRRDPRVVAAAIGASWVTVFDPATFALRSGTVTGAVTAVAVDRDRGGALVATRSPDRLYRLDLGDLHVLWQAALPAAPTAVAPTADGIVAAGGSSLWAVTRDGTRPFATAKGSIAGLAVSDEGRVVHVAVGDQVQAFAADGTPARLLTLGTGRDASALAAVPAGSSLFAGGHGTTGAATSGSSGGAGVPVPVTSALADAASRVLGSSVLPAALAVGFVVLLLASAGIRLALRRGTS
ncbi:MAG TPA: hypothetical protein VF763_02835 [Candidatus Limnocylindrales bacterium]